MTHLRCGDILNRHNIAHFPQSEPVKEYLKLVNILQIYGRGLVARFYGSWYITHLTMEETQIPKGCDFLAHAVDRLGLKQ